MARPRRSMTHGSDDAEAPLPAQNDHRRMDRHDEPHRAAMRHRSRPHQDARRRRRATAPTPSPDRRSSSPPASTTSPTTSSISCSPASRARRPGVKGISLFLVPKFLVNDDGSLGERNGVVCGSIEHKMGIHGNSTCVLNYDGAKGWLVGEENRGLNAMFVMMNGARLGVAVQGLAHFRGRLPERRRLRQGAPAGPLADRRRRARTSPPIRSSSIPTSGACCSKSAPSTRRRAR